MSISDDSFLELDNDYSIDSYDSFAHFCNSNPLILTKLHIEFQGLSLVLPPSRARKRRGNRSERPSTRRDIL